VVGRDQLILVVGTDHPWCGRERIEPNELTTSEWVMREPGSGTRSGFEAALVVRRNHRIPFSGGACDTARCARGSISR
jgi:DNA-binding transcriptional LysR family regulator